jgi:Fe-S cluster assembly protein SufD
MERPIALDFRADAAVLEAALAELVILGERGGGAVDAAVRRRALATYTRLAGRRVRMPPQWRHDYAALGFEGLQWSTGRATVPALPNASRARREDEGDLPALALENAGGLVHAGSMYLEAPDTLRDPRFTLISLADARRAMPERVDAVHLQIIAPATDRFTALTAAFQNCGAYVEIAAGAVLDAPLQIVWLAAPGEPAAVFSHTVVRLGAGAHATIVERHIGEGEAFAGGTVEVELGPGARLDYAVVQQADDGARLFLRRRARCAAGATIAWHVADLGAALVRGAGGAHLAGARAAAETNAFFYARGFTHVECIVEVDHDVAHTASRTTVRSAATDRGRGRFAGALRFGERAAHCTASMRDDGLILARDAYLDAAPVLAVPAQGISATHTSSIGSLDEEELFYVQSRGISRALAERMMALAFFEPAIARFPGDALRDEVRTALDARLNEVPDTFD